MMSSQTKDTPMMRYQHLLPHLPVPPLQQTLDKYLRVAEPMLTPEAMAKTRKEVEVFRQQGGVGEHLQKLLENRAKTHTNWLSDWWNSVAYLSYRLPTPIHVTPATSYPPEMTRGFEEDKTKLLRFAANYTYLSLVDMERIETGQYPVDKAGGKPMCMDQYLRLHSSCRIPHPGKDKRAYYPVEETTHFVVIYKCQFFLVPICYPGSKWKVLSPSDLYKQYLAIVSSSSQDCPINERVGLLTTEDRDTWAEVFQRLSSDPLNAKTLDAIWRSAFITCLDDPCPNINTPGTNRTQFSDATYTLVTNRVLHGHCSAMNTGNRWFDKTMQVVIGADGGCGSILEHSMADGPPAMALTNSALAFCVSPEASAWSIDNNPLPDALKPRKLEWNLTPRIKNDILTAAEKIDRLIDNVDLQVCRFEKFGKGFVKEQKLSPDGFFQAAIQLAYRRLYDCAVPTYESASTRFFQLGRTETIRSATPESTEFTKAMDGSGVTVHEKIALLKKSIAAHQRYSKEAMTGEGIDRHLLGLRLIAKENGIPLPGIFTDPSHAYLFSWRLSTSQVPSSFHIILSFGPVIPEGYGICYNPRSDSFLFVVTSFRSCDATNSGRLAGAIERALLDIQEMFMKSKL